MHRHFATACSISGAALHTMTETAFKTISDRLAGSSDAHPRPRSAPVPAPQATREVLHYWPHWVRRTLVRILAYSAFASIIGDLLSPRHGDIWSMPAELRRMSVMRQNPKNSSLPGTSALQLTPETPPTLMASAQTQCSQFYSEW